MQLQTLLAGAAMLSGAAADFITSDFDVSGTAEGCTTIAAGAAATVDGSTLTTHTADCKDCDFRVMHVPARDTEEGEPRPVFQMQLGYPRYVGEAMGPYYVSSDLSGGAKGEPDTPAVGYIPETGERTFAYHDGVYGVMNEKGLGIGESTCTSKMWTHAPSDGGDAMFDIGALTHVALERCETARCAIELMGELSTKHGFYPADASSAEGGEALSIVDGSETWMFQILTSFNGSSAVWAAQRVPDDHVAVVANAFTIGELDLDDADNFLASDNVQSEAEFMGFWDPDTEGLFDFTAAYGTPEKLDLYSVRRMWRVYDVVAPSLKLSTELLRYPFSVKPDKPVSVETLMALNRDVYEGTQFDLTKGMAAGPFGSPNRYENDPRILWPRAISLYRTIYSTVLQTRPSLPDYLSGIMWFAPDAPHSASYVPFYAGAHDLPESYRTGSQHEFTRESAYWAFDFVSNWADLKFKYMIEDIKGAQSATEGKWLSEVDLVTQRALAHSDEHKARDYLTQYVMDVADETISTWWTLADYLIVKYNDGYVNQPVMGGDEDGYPTWWLEAIGAEVQPSRTDAELGEAEAEASSGGVSSAAAVIMSTLLLVSGLAVGFAIGRREPRNSILYTSATTVEPPPRPETVEGPPVRAYGAI